MAREEIEEQAKKLATESKRSEPDIIKIIWFPDDDEVRLIELDENTVVSLSGQVEPFYFEPEEDITVPSGIAIIRPEEYRKLVMPEGWGNWEDGIELDVAP